MSAQWPVRTVGQRLDRIAALAALVEGLAIVLPGGESGHDFTLDAELYLGLGAVANVMREDYDAIQLVMNADDLDRLAPPAPHDGAR